MKVELHAHSHYSRGTKVPWEGIPSPEEVIKQAKKIGLGAVAISDHDTIEAWDAAKKEAEKQGILFIPGIEISTSPLKGDYGHVIGLGVNEHIKRGLGVGETLDKIKQQGGLSLAPHPFDLQGKGIMYGFERADCVEVFNSLCVDRFANKLAEKAARWSEKPMIAGSDAHTLDMIGTSVNMVDAYSVDDILRYLKAGDVRMVKRYTPPHVLTSWARERLIRSYPDVVSYVNNNYHPARGWLARRLLHKFTNSSRCWCRLAGMFYGVSVVYGKVKTMSY